MENLTKECFNTEMETLISLYDYKTTKKHMELYYKYLESSFTDNTFKNVIALIIKQERFFPKISVFFSLKTKTKKQLLKEYK
ncbi:MAG: hypothetical protein KAS32_10075 [Candidatus Peribacteraceae bacterium]|nr:hypothetical protein [Candidatus Peribacteraceae bacterium]